MSDRPILVTGANGFIGRALCAALARDGTPIVATDIAFDDDWHIDGARREICDVTHLPSCLARLSATPARAIVHCGGVSGPMLAKDQPNVVHATNILGTLHVLEAARRQADCRVVLLSSIAVYGDHHNHDPVPEDAPLRATDPYGASKVAAERIAESYRATFGMDVVALRIASVYGPGRRTPCLVRALIDSARDGAPPVPISTDPTSTRQLLFIDDCVAAIVACLRVPRLAEFAYNVVGPEFLTEREVARKVGECVGGVRTVEFAEARCFDGYLGALDGARALREFGFRAQTDLFHGTGTMNLLIAD